MEDCTTSLTSSKFIVPLIVFELIRKVIIIKKMIMWNKRWYTISSSITKNNFPFFGPACEVSTLELFCIYAHERKPWESFV